MRKLILLFVAGLLATPAAAQLDRPITPTQPTVGSEIKRGADVAERCAIGFRGPFQMAAFGRCIDGQQAENRQNMGSGYEAFDAGLYLVAKRNADIAAEVVKGSSFAANANVLETSAKVYALRLKQAQEILDLSDADVERASIIGQ